MLALVINHCATPLMHSGHVRMGKRKGRVFDLRNRVLIGD